MPNRTDFAHIQGGGGKFLPRGPQNIHPHLPSSEKCLLARDGCRYIISPWIRINDMGWQHPSRTQARFAQTSATAVQWGGKHRKHPTTNYLTSHLGACGALSTVVASWVSHTDQPSLFFFFEHVSASVSHQHCMTSCQLEKIR